MLLFLLLFVIGPLADLVLLVRLGQTYGFGRAVALVLGTAALGILVIRGSAARSAIRVRAELAQGRTPGGALMDELAVLAGGVLLVLPGPITDVLGLAMLFPPTRFVLKGLMRLWLERAAARGTLRVATMRWGVGPTDAPESPFEPAAARLDPRHEILVPPPEGGGGPTLG